jgi:acyl transferase domain-containing protein
MIAVAISKEKAEKFIGNLEGGTAVVACINSPESVTISGDESAVLELEKVFIAEGRMSSRKSCWSWVRMQCFRLH